MHLDELERSSKVVLASLMDWMSTPSKAGTNTFPSIHTICVCSQVRALDPGQVPAMYVVHVHMSSATGIQSRSQLMYVCYVVYQHLKYVFDALQCGHPDFARYIGTSELAGGLYGAHAAQHPGGTYPGTAKTTAVAKDGRLLSWRLKKTELPGVIARLITDPVLLQLSSSPDPNPHPSRRHLSHHTYPSFIVHTAANLHFFSTLPCIL